LLFFPSFGGTLLSGGVPEGDLWVQRELIRFLVRTLPGTLLIWRLAGSAQCRLRPRRADLRAFLSAFPLLYLTGFLCSLASSRLPVRPPPPLPVSPAGPGQWLAAAFLCMGSGYLEESYFRLYLLSRFAAGGLGPWKSLFLSTLLFALCHVYEGPWGVLNAAAAGTVLSLIFRKRRALHGAAWAHGLYNTAVYVTAALRG
jgi:membrane protease YdiL (CAAX protease family)